MMIARDTAPIRKRKNHFLTIFLISDRMRSPAVCRLLMVLLCALLTGSGQAQNRYVHLLAGTYTSGASEGIYVYRFDTQTGKAEHEFTARCVENHSFLPTSSSEELVYATRSEERRVGKKCGRQC